MANKNIFNSIAIKKPKRNFFDLSHDRKFSTELGKLTPILCQEVLPGDTFKMNSAQMIRFAPMVAPVMHKMDVYTHYFFVPNRLLWSNWERFITGGERKGDTLPAPVHPYVMMSNVQQGGLADYLGVPVGYDYSPPIKVNALPFQAYYKIFDEYYRDQNLKDPTIPEGTTLTDGDNTTANPMNYINNAPLNRCWEHDYFTSALPFAQKGDDVLLPLGDLAPLVFDATEGNTSVVKSPDGGIPTYVAGNIDLRTNSDTDIHAGTTGADVDEYDIDVTQNTFADLSSATSTTINDLRKAFKVQEWLERNARGGTRYVESIFSQFGVRSSDARLQRPQYLGGGKSHVAISEVLQQSETTTGAEGSPIGTMAGHGINVGQDHGFSATFEEHGFIIGIMSVMPKPAYQQGLNKKFSRFDVLDYAFPVFGNLGEQEVKGIELYAKGLSSYRESTFGYVPRYSDYKYAPSTVHGDMVNELSHWHLGRIFATPPNLNEDFVKCEPDTRIFAVEDGVHHLWCQVNHNISVLRSLPKFGVPSL